MKLELSDLLSNFSHTCCKYFRRFSKSSAVARHAENREDIRDYRGRKLLFNDYRPISNICVFKHENNTRNINYCRVVIIIFLIEHLLINNNSIERLLNK